MTEARRDPTLFGAWKPRRGLGVRINIKTRVHAPVAPSYQLRRRSVNKVLWLFAEAPQHIVVAFR